MKKQFVEGIFSAAISEGFGYIDHLEYYETEYDEMVAIVCNNGHKYHVCVTADSKQAIMQDVIKEASRH
ncbi:MAG: hypothetical protein IKB96_02265 [Prevotella sp.]|nr:hypothetical protein [Prevotella sp.]